MKDARRLLALLGLLAGPVPLHAQLFLPPPIAPAGGFGFTFQKRNVYVSGGFGFYSPVAYAPFYPVNRVTVIAYAPPPPVVVPFGFRPGWGDLAGLEEILRQRQQAPPPEPPEREPRPMPGAPAGGFRPVREEERARARLPVAPAPPLPLPPPVPDPKTENARLATVGREAFAAGAYGRAAEFFRRATAAAPGEPLAYFFLAQAYFALGKYHDAVDAIHAGLRLQPDWPHTRFRLRDLYGAHDAAFLDHLRRVEDALARHPHDPVLLFLYAYQLWFDGRQDEARAVFRRAAAVTPDTGAIERFLPAL
jgi:hypothetical protein